MDRVHGSPFMDRVHGPLIMDRVHGPPIFTSWGCTINYNLMTFDDTLRDGSSFGKPCISLIAHLPLKFMLNSSFSFSLVIVKHTVWFWKAYLIVLHLVFPLSWQHKYQHLRADLSIVYCKQTSRDWQLIWIFLLMSKNTQHFYCCSLVLAYSFRSWLQSTLPSIQFWPSLDTELFVATETIN